MNLRLLGALGLALLVSAGVAVFLWWRWPGLDRPPLDPSGGAAVRVPDPGDEWPAFRGPTGLGLAPRAKPPVEWSATKNLRWKRELPGKGASSPIVWGERVFVTCWDGAGGVKSRHLVCVNRDDGAIRWSKAEPAALPEDAYGSYLDTHGYASNTPCTDGERVYAFFGKSGVIAYSMEGEEQWRKDVGKLSNKNRWGSGASLMIAGDNLIVNAADEGRAIFAFDRKTGEQAWKTASRSLELSYGTPVLLPVDGKHQLILAVPGELWALNPLTGKRLWHAPVDIQNNASPSIAAEDGVVFAVGGHPHRNLFAVRVGGELLWEKEKGMSYVPSPVAQGGKLFLVTEEGFARCLDAKTGAVLKETRLAPTYGSPILADGKLYCLTRNGGCFVLQADEGLKRLALNKLDGTSDFNSTPAMSKGELFLRSDRALYCIAEGK